MVLNISEEYVELNISKEYGVQPPPKANFELEWGDNSDCAITYCYRVKKNLQNRLKYWLFCKFFPFKIKRWDKED